MDACSIRSVFGAGIVIGDPGAHVIQPRDLAAAGKPKKFTYFTSTKVKILTLMRLPGEEEREEREERESREEREEREERAEGPQASEDVDAFLCEMRRLVRWGQAVVELKSCSVCECGGVGLVVGMYVCMYVHVCVRERE